MLVWARTLTVASADMWGVLFVVDGDVGEQCAVEDAAFG